MLRLIEVTFEEYLNPVKAFFEPFDLRIQHDRREEFFQTAFERFHQIGINARQQTISQFHHTDTAAEGGIDRPQFQPHVSAADDQKAFGNFCQSEGTGGIHDPAPFFEGNTGKRGGV